MKVKDLEKMEFEEFFHSIPTTFYMNYHKDLPYRKVNLLIMNKDNEYELGNYPYEVCLIEKSNNNKGGYITPEFGGETYKEAIIKLFEFIFKDKEITTNLIMNDISAAY